MLTERRTPDDYMVCRRCGECKLKKGYFYTDRFNKTGYKRVCIECVRRNNRKNRKPKTMNTRTIKPWQKNLLLYLETCAVNFRGKVNPECINKDDTDQMKDWMDAGYVFSGRICSRDLTPKGTLWVRFSEEAMNDAHALRKIRAADGWMNRTYQTTEEFRNSPDPS